MLVKRKAHSLARMSRKGVSQLPLRPHHPLYQHTQLQSCSSKPHSHSLQPPPALHLRQRHQLSLSPSRVGPLQTALSALQRSCQHHSNCSHSRSRSRSRSSNRSQSLRIVLQRRRVLLCPPPRMKQGLAVLQPAQSAPPGPGHTSNAFLYVACAWQAHFVHSSLPSLQLSVCVAFLCMHWSC